MRPRSIALTRHARATSMVSCLFGLSSALPITERISSSSLSISFFDSSLSSELSMLKTTTMPRCAIQELLCRHNLCRISIHWVVCLEGAVIQSVTKYVSYPF
uniref:Secreted protein n=1 Tax=Labrus bergylta TaxID=56723 RepID=A0A3Q3FJ81_9LABR